MIELKGSSLFFIDENEQIPKGYVKLGFVDKNQISFDVEPYLTKAGSVRMGWHFDGTVPNETNFYFDYTKAIPQPVSFLLSNAKESFYSLLQAKEIFFVNQIEEPVRYYSGFTNEQIELDKYYWEEVRIYREAESKLVEKVVIIKKV